MPQSLAGASKQSPWRWTLAAEWLRVAPPSGVSQQLGDMLLGQS
jgi:hypothetical protein